MQVRFDPASPDGWTVRTAGDVVLVLAPTDATRVDALTDLLATGDGFAGVLDDLLRGGISTAPSFALIGFAGGSARVVVRGPVRVIAGADEVDGEGVATWVERPFPVDALRVEAPGGSWSFAVEGAAAPPAVARTEAVVATDAVVATPVASGASTGSFDALESTIEPAGESAPRHEFLFAPPTLVETSSVGIDADPMVSEEAPAAPDHDGLTILTGDLPERPMPEHPVPTPAGDHDGSTVLAAEVAGLGSGVAPPPFSMDDAVLSLELPDGRVEPLSQPVLLGRSPNLARSTGPLPKLLTVGADDPDISRTHARIAVEGGTVLVTDLGSRNGTSVVLPGRAPQRLREGEPTAVLVGTVIDLGGGVTLTVREES